MSILLAVEYFSGGDRVTTSQTLEDSRSAGSIRRTAGASPTIPELDLSGVGAISLESRDVVSGGVEEVWDAG